MELAYVLIIPLDPDFNRDARFIIIQIYHHLTFRQE